jgi:prolyl 4-hydroxylase
MYLPENFSSTSELLDVNGNEFVQHIRDEPMLAAGVLIPQKEILHHSTAKYQLNIRSYERQHPAVTSLKPSERATHAMSVKFRSLIRGKVKIWYDDHRGGVENGHLGLGQETTTNTYEGHEFFFTDYHNKDKVYARFRMHSGQVFYVVEDPNQPAPAELKSQTDREVRFIRDYSEKNGIPWRHYYGPNGPRPPPIHFMWPATQIGQVHAVTSSHGYWTCDGSVSECQSLHPVHLELEVISLAPRAFVINNFLNGFEVDAIIAAANSRLHHSSVGDTETGAFESDVRTSSNAWLPRSLNHITETLFRRAADVLQIDEKRLQRSDSAEDMQVVHYQDGQRYDAHHDWGVSGYPESRYLTLLLYLSDMESPNAGGETSFPKADGGRGIKVHPGKGNAVLFYNLLPDGNGDDLALHAALPVWIGEKWLANFWVWDPKIK